MKSLSSYGPSSFTLIPDLDDPETPPTQFKIFCNGIRCDDYYTNWDSYFELNTLGNGMGGNYGYFSLGNGYTSDGELILETTIEMEGETGQIQCKTLSATDIYYENLYPSSLEEKKKNFEKFENGLDIIKDVDIYK